MGSNEHLCFVDHFLCGSLLLVSIFSAQVYVSPFNILWGQFDLIFAVELSSGCAT